MKEINYDTFYKIKLIYVFYVFLLMIPILFHIQDFLLKPI